MSRTRRTKEDPLVGELIEAIGARPASRQGVVRAVEGMHELERALGHFVREYEQALAMPPSSERSNRLGHSVAALETLQRAIDKAIHAAAVAKLGTHAPCWVYRYYTKDPRLVAAMPAYFRKYRGTVAPPGIPYEHDASIGWYAMIPSEGASDEPMLMYDLLANRFVVTRPETWRALVAGRYSERLPKDLKARYGTT